MCEIQEEILWIISVCNVKKSVVQKIVKEAPEDESIVLRSN